MAADAPESVPVATPSRIGRRRATGLRKLFNPLAWPARFQVLWGVFEVLVAASLVAFADWRQPWLPVWVPLVVAGLWAIDGLGNITVAIVRLRRGRVGR